MKSRSLFLAAVCVGTALLLWIAFQPSIRNPRESTVAGSQLSPTPAGRASGSPAAAPPERPEQTGHPAGAGTGPKLSGSSKGTNPQISPTIALPLAGTPGAFGSPPSPQGENAAALIDLDKVNLMLRDYRTLMGENPVGTNAEIMKAIMGGNPRGAMLGPPEDQKLNGNGELIDRWGTPYFFHQLSGDHMEIRSAGPDRKMWTDDDVLLK